MTLRSATRGVVDYSKVDIHDGSWWQRWRYLVLAMDNEDYTHLMEKAFQFQLALVSNGKLDADNFNSVQKEAKEIFQDIEGQMRPWLGRRTREERDIAEKEQYNAAWEAMAGFSMDDKEAIAEWELELEEAMKSSGKGRAEEAQKEEEARQNFDKRRAELQAKRQRQQGR